MLERLIELRKKMRAGTLLTCEDRIEWNTLVGIPSLQLPIDELGGWKRKPDG